MHITNLTLFHKKELINAIKNDSMDRVKSLVKDGADIHADNDIALSMACFNGNLDIVKYLIQIGANVSSNVCALFSAVEKNHYNVTKYLLKYGADVHAMHDHSLKKAAEKVTTILPDY